MDLSVLSGSHIKMLVLFLLLHSLQLASSSEVKWRGYQNFDGKFPLNGTLTSSLNQLDCGRTCSSMNSTCISFFYAPRENLNCRMYDHVLGSFEGLSDVTGATYHILDGVSVPALSASTPVSTTASSTSTPNVASPSPTSGGTPPVSTSPSYSCPANMDIYNTVVLSDNTTFTFKFMSTGRDYSASIGLCEADSGYMARVLTVPKMEMLRYLASYCAVNSNYRVDGNNHQVNTWMTDNGIPLPMTSDFWQDGSPSGDPDRCVFMNRFRTYHWQDTLCDTYMKFVCEKD